MNPDHHRTTDPMRLPRRTGLLALALTLLATSCQRSGDEEAAAKAEAAARAAKEEAAYELSQLRRDLELWETKHHRALKQRDAARQRLAGKEEEISAATKDIALKEAELASRPDPATAAKEDRETPAEVPAGFITKVTPMVVVIEGDQGSGTGFLCEVDGERWVYTAAHVLSGNRRIAVRDSRGRTYKDFDFLECAEGVDLVRLKPSGAEFEGLELESPDEAPEVGDVIVAIGNSLGTGSLSAEPGRVRNIDEDMWEVDAEIIPGNSGGPVLSLESGRVAGIVTHLIISRARGERSLLSKPETKRFAARLDKEWKWRRMDVARFVKEWDYIEKMNRESSIAWASAYLMYAGSAGRQLDVAADRKLRPIARDIITGERDHIHVQRMKLWLEEFEEAGRLKKGALIDEGNAILRQIFGDLRIGKNDPGADDFSWYHRQSYEAAREWRDDLTSEFED